MDSFVGLLFQLIVLIFSVMVHEVSHGFVAERLGDPTARQMGRLTLNPVSHIDLYGSIIFPLMLYTLSGGTMLFGWAKPVPYDPRFLKDPQGGAAQIAAAGPLSNFLIAFIFGMLLRVLPFIDITLPVMFSTMLSVVVYMNVLLGVFNLVPIPPLDGSRVLWNYLPRTNSVVSLELFLERYGFILLLAFVFFGFDLIRPIVHVLYLLFAGG